MGSGVISFSQQPHEGGAVKGTSESFDTLLRSNYSLAQRRFIGAGTEADQ